MTLLDKWFDRVSQAPNGCWIWSGARWARYGRFYVGHGERVVAHKWGWETLWGPVPNGFELDHLCRNIWCVNPEHLEPVTHTENVRRGRSAVVNRSRLQSLTHCEAGHEFNQANTRYRGKRRFCRICDAKRAKEYRRSKKGNTK